jgi:hypothetical protein
VAYSGVFALAVQRIFGNRRLQKSKLAVYQRNPHTESSAINSGYDGHQQAPFCTPGASSGKKPWFPTIEPMVIFVVGMSHNAC